MGGNLPDQHEVKALVVKLLSGADLNTMTVRHIREAVQQELKGEGDYDFDDPSFKALVKQLVTEAVQQQHQQKEEKENGHGEKGAGKGNRQEAEEEEEEGSSSEEEEDEEDEDSSDGEEDSDDGSPAGSKRKKSGSKGDGASKKKQKAKDKKEEKPADPGFKLLQSLAKAMALTPAIYKGFGEMTHEEKVEALRQRLKEKGAEFDQFPTQQDIKKAEDKKSLERDLEGIDLSNVIEDGRRRRGGSDEEARKMDKAKKKKKKKSAVKDDASSASEEELEFD